MHETVMGIKVAGVSYQMTSRVRLYTVTSDMPHRQYEDVAQSLWSVAKRYGRTDEGREEARNTWTGRLTLADVLMLAAEGDHATLNQLLREELILSVRDFEYRSVALIDNDTDFVRY